MPNNVKRITASTDISLHIRSSRRYFLDFRVTQMLTNSSLKSTRYYYYLPHLSRRRFARGFRQWLVCIFKTCTWSLKMCDAACLRQYNSLIQKFQTLHDISFRYIFFFGGGGAGEGTVTQEKGIDVSTMQKGVIV